MDIRTALSRGRSLAALLGVVVLLSACAAAQTQSSPPAPTQLSRPRALRLPHRPWHPRCTVTLRPSVRAGAPCRTCRHSGGGSVAAITVQLGQLVAVGSVPDAGTTRAAVWTSADGLSWTRARDEPSFGQAGIDALARSGSGLVAVGCVTGPEGCAGNPVAKIWTASDGAVWTPAAFKAGFDPSARRYAAVTAGGPGYVAVGSDISGGFPQVPADASIVTSGDGKTWTPVAANPGLKGATMGGVAASGATLVVVGQGSNGAPVVWTSSDGRPGPGRRRPACPTTRKSATWPPGGLASSRSAGRAAARRPGARPMVAPGEQAPASDALSGARMLHVAVTSHGFIAIGTVGDGSGAAWTSPDGTSWTRLDLRPDLRRRPRQRSRRDREPDRRVRNHAGGQADRRRRHTIRSWRPRPNRSGSRPPPASRSAGLGDRLNTYTDHSSSHNPGRQSQSHLHRRTLLEGTPARPTTDGGSPTWSASVTTSLS